MIDNKLQIALILAVILYFVILFNFLKAKRLELKYTLLWIFSGLLMLIVSIFPKIMIFFTGLVGIQVPANSLFALALFCIIIIAMSLTSIVSKLNERIKRLAQSVALLEKRTRELEEKLKSGENE